MSATRMAQRLLSDADLAFIADAERGELPEPTLLRYALASDEALRAEVLGGDRVFQLVLSIDDALVRISPRLFFEVLLRRAIKELGRTVHVFERAGTERVPVFLNESDVRAVADPSVVDYLADMLTSFTRVESQTLRVRVRRGVWRKERYSDLDVPSLLRLASQTEKAHRMPVYKRAGDASLLILGVFPDFAGTAVRYPGTGT